jgi:gamma-glutamyltranspeptidase/glutathione hydrolase
MNPTATGLPSPQRTSWRPTLSGRRYAVACGHYLAAQAAARVLDRGGNAVDAGVTAAMALAVLQPDIVSFAGVAPSLVYTARDRSVTSLAGLGYWPASTDVARLAREGGGHVPEGLLRTIMPAAPATHIEALRRFGTISFADAATPAFEIARDGFAMFPVVAYHIEKHAKTFDKWPSSQAIFRPGGRSPRVGEKFRQPDLAATIGRMIDAERDARGDRDAGLRAAHDCFYRGPIAAAIADFHAREGGFVTRADLAGFETPVEASIRTRYRDLEVHSCDAWCQGVVLLEALKIVEGFDLQRLGHNTPAYVHTVTEAFNLAFADREAYVGDPKFVHVPVEGMVSDAYARSQRARIRMDRAFGEMPEPGTPPGARGTPHRGSNPVAAATPGPSPDTIYCCVVDADGNGYSATLSDTAYDTPAIPGLGLFVSSRGCQSRLTPGHPSEVKPGKRPRLTPMPALALRENGELYMTFGTPGGDVQPQAMLQVLLNVHEFGLQVQDAIERPRFASYNYPNSFAPHGYVPGRLNIERRLGEDVIGEMRALGHDVLVWPELTWEAGAVCAILNDRVNGFLHAGADPRREAYAAAW